MPRIKVEINNIKKYYQLCNKGILTNKKHFEKVENPKISLIIPVYNREKYICIKQYNKIYKKYTKSIF